MPCDEWYISVDSRRPSTPGLGFPPSGALVSLSALWASCACQGSTRTYDIRKEWMGEFKFRIRTWLNKVETVRFAVSVSSPTSLFCSIRVEPYQSVGREPE
eukprot:1178376-Prorocentrum_minimum.AAC.1